ncbi:MAG TPA: penicillin acylase family protein [Desulfomonilia bacterium]
MARDNSGKVLKTILYILLALVVIISAGGYVFYRSMMKSPVPKVEGELKAGGLRESVEVLRDEWGVPHIYAKNMHDLMFAQGYVQAQDRFWQMEFFRKTCGGRIEELTGRKAALVNADIYLRSLGIYRVVEEEYKSYSSADRALLDAFAKGVNAYISKRTPGQLSVNYSILGLTGVKFKVEPWSALDSLAFSKLMAWDLGLSRDMEQPRTKLYAKLGAKMAEQFLVPPWPLKEKPTILLDEDIKAMFPDALNPSSPGQAVKLSSNEIPAGKAFENTGPLADLSMLMGQTEGTGSNSWVATGGLTKSGMPLLANDPHLGIQQPSIWYEIALHCPDDGRGRPFDVAGFAFASSPGVVVGHNNDIAWGTTNVYPDVNDQYQIKVNPGNPLQYEWDGKWRDMTVHEESILAGNGKPPIVINVRKTHLGPIINDNKYDEKTGQTTGFNVMDPLALHWTGLMPGTIALAIIRLDRAKDFNEFRDALRYWDTPSQSVVYADRKGNIGYQMPGKIPVRVKGHTGQVPVPGWTSAYEWKGFVPFELLPHLLNPARNFIVACNQEVAPPEYFAMLDARLGPDVNADFGSRYNKWVYGYRSQRAYELIRQLAPNTTATFQTMQSDNKCLSADELLPYLGSLKLSDPALAEARDWLMKWDRFTEEDSPEAALYMEFCMKLFKNTFQDQLGDILKSDGLDKEMWALNLLMKDPLNDWWDDAATAGIKENRDDILTRSFSEGYSAAVASLGTDRSKWKWGTLHKATFVSNPLGASKIGLLESLVNQGPVATSGSTECLNNNIWYASKGDFSVGLIPSMRMIVDMSDLTKCVSINSTGSSGHPGNKWYGDQIEPWAKLKYRPMLWSREQVETGARHRLTLKP